MTEQMTIWVSHDGKRFDTESECRLWEITLAGIKRIRRNMIQLSREDLDGEAPEQEIDTWNISGSKDYWPKRYWNIRDAFSEFSYPIEQLNPSDAMERYELFMSCFDLYWDGEKFQSKQDRPS